MPEPLHMPLSDTNARRDALDVTASFIVEAPAGSGKTGLLIQRFLRLLAEGGVERPEEVLAITFTRKATGEMRERVLNELHNAAHRIDESTMVEFQFTTRQLAQKVMTRDAALGWHLLDQPQRLNIRTIDSLCHEIAGHLPVLSGLGGRLQPVDDARALYLAAARQTLEELASDDHVITDALHVLLLHRDGRLSDCEQLIAKMLGQRDQWARLIPAGEELAEEYLDNVLRPRMETELRSIVVAALTRLHDLFSPEDLRELAALAHEAAGVLAADGKEGVLGPCLQITDSPTIDAGCVEHWRALSRLLLKTDGEWRTTVDKRIGFLPGTFQKQRILALLGRLHGNAELFEALTALSALPPARYTEEEWRITKALFRLLRRAHAQLRIVFAASGQCDFSELSMAALEALETPNGSTELAAALGLKFRHLLVDEMQDTSISQYKLLELLTQGWDGASQTVFLVGDPRQSIYLFRQACVEQFSQAIYTNKLGEIELRHLQLTANFRSHPSLVAAFNEHFAAIRPHQVHAEDDSPHLPAEAGRRENHEAGIRLHWHAHTLPNGSSAIDKEQAAENEAEEIARIVQLATEELTPQAGGRPLIAVLVRAKNHAARIAAALRRAQIPYRATEIDALGSQQEVLDALSLLRALLHPADRVAWLAVLHAPWCGLGVRDLHIAAGGDDPALAKRCIDDLLAERASLMSADGRGRALATQQILRSAIAQQGRLSVAQWLEGVWHSLGAPLYLASHERQNVAAFFALITACEERGETIDAALLLERLEDLCAPESEAPALVDIMTIHKAKGLEWKVVIVPALDRQGGNDAAPLLQYVKDVMPKPGQEQKPPLFAPIPRTGVSDESIHKYLSGMRTQAQRLELRRLFYVAGTRARETLHLFAQPVATKSGVSARSNSLLGAAWPAAEPHFGPSIAPPALALAAETQATRTVRRIPAAVDIATLYTKHAPAPLPTGDTASPPQRSYKRTEGSLSARALGSVVHAYLDKLAQEFAAGKSMDGSVLEGWMPGIHAMLRAYGLAPGELKPRAEQALAALRSTLADPQGHWLLAPHPQAASEFSVSLYAGDGSLATYRMDRIFRAGETPDAPGEDFLWIADYKISAHGDDADETFFAIESEKHRSQLETYARAQQSTLKNAKGIRLAAFYPLRKSGEKLKVWTYEL